MVSHKIITSLLMRVSYFVFTSKFIICFIANFTSKTKCQPIVNLLNESEHTYGILNLEDEIHSIWDLWRSGLQECKGNGFFGSWTG